MANENRKETRIPTKLMVRIHAGVLRTWGLVSDLSHNGLFIHATHKLHPEAILDIEIMMPDGKAAILRGVVKRIVILPDAHRKFGMGVEVMEKDNIYTEYVGMLSKESRIPDHASVN